MTREEQAIVYFKDMRKRMCEDHLKICPKDSVAYRATLIEKGFYDAAIKALEQDPCEDAVSKKDVLSEIIRFSTEEGASVECQQLYCDVNNMPSVTPQEPRWIPVNERVAEFPCLACDIFDQIFIPSGIVVLNSRCYEGKDFDFNVEKFLRGKEVIMCGGKKAYLRPREIAAWMPLPEPYRVKGEKHDN